MARVRLPDIEQVSGIGGSNLQAPSGSARYLNADTGAAIPVYSARIGGSTTSSGVTTVTRGKPDNPWVDSGPTVQYYVTPAGQAEQGPFYWQSGTYQRSITDPVGAYSGASVGGTTNAAVIQAHFDAIATAGGGMLTAPAGTFSMEAELNPPLNVPWMFVGERDSTVLQWSTDLGAGKYAVKSTGTFVNNLMQGFRDIKFVGPNSSTTVGTSPVAMNGPQLERKQHMHFCRIEGFKGNLCKKGTHTKVSFTNARLGDYGLYYETVAGGDPQSGDQFGDDIYIGCRFTGNRLAGVEVGDNTGIVNTSFTGCHFGFQPYSFHRASGITSGNWLTGITFTSCNFEQVGNGGFYAEDAGAFDVIRECVFNTGGTSASVTYNPTATKSVTIAAATDIVTSTAHGFTDGTRVVFPTLTGGAGLTAGTTVYYVRDSTTNTFKVATTNGGTAIDVTTDATAGTVATVGPSEAFNPTYTIAARNTDYWMRAGTVERCRVNGGGMFLTFPGTVGHVQATNWRGNKWTEADRLITNIASYGLPVFTSLSTTGDFEGSTVEASNTVYKIGKPNGTYAAGDVLEAVPTNGSQAQVREYSAGTSALPIRGIALEAGVATTGLERRLYAVAGRVKATAGGTSTGDWVRPNRSATGVSVGVAGSNTATIASGSTSVTITHGLGGTPRADEITVTPTNNPTNDPGHIWVSGISTTQFTINCRADPGTSGLSLSWRALSPDLIGWQVEDIVSGQATVELRGLI